MLIRVVKQPEFKTVLP